MNAIGKTVARIEQEPVDLEWGYREYDKMRIHFTDGSVLEVKGSSWEDVDLDLTEYSRSELRDKERAASKVAMGRRERLRVAKLRRSSEPPREPGPFEVAFAAEVADAWQDLRKDFNRAAFNS